MFGKIKTKLLLIPAKETSNMGSKQNTDRFPESSTERWRCLHPSSLSQWKFALFCFFSISQLRTFALIVCAQRYSACNATVICYALLLVEVLKPLQKSWTISRAQRWITEDRDQSKLIKKYLWKASRLLHDWYLRCFISRALVHLTFIDIFQALVKITWRQKRWAKNSRPAKEWHIFFRIIMKR